MKTIAFILSFFSLQFFGMSLFMVDGPSMEPTMHSGEVFIISDIVGRENLKRGDIVVFELDNKQGYFYVKRIIGLPGETIVVRGDGIYLEDETGVTDIIDEPYLESSVTNKTLTESYRDGYEHSYRVPEGKYFLLGDNRNHSLDSRYFVDPYVSLESIKGKYVMGLLNGVLGGESGKDVNGYAGSTLDELDELEDSVDFDSGWVDFDLEEAKFVIDTVGGEVEFNIEIADDPEEQKQGLMHRENLDDSYGMLFIFDQRKILSFWMKNTLIPLDMIFLDNNFEIVHIAKNAIPCVADPCKTYPSVKEAKYVFEINGGGSDLFGIGIGDKAVLLK